MSLVTNVILMAGVGFDPSIDEPSQKAYQAIDDFLQSTCRQSLKRLDDNRGAYGGSKCFEVSIWTGAFNYLHLTDFIEILKSIDFPDWVQLSYCGQEDEGFTFIQIQSAS